MSNKEDVKKVYDQIHAPEALLGKVMEMKKEKFSFRNSVKYALVAAAALVMTFVAGNGICYAATGESLISNIKFFVNGKEVEHEVTWREEDGRMIGTIKADLDYEDEHTGEPGKVSATIEVQPDGISVDEFAISDVDSLEDTVVISVVVPEEGCNVFVEETDGEFELSVDTNLPE